MLMQCLKKAEVPLHWTAVDPRRFPPLRPCPGLGTPHESLEHLHTDWHSSKLTPNRGEGASEPLCKSTCHPHAKDDFNAMVQMSWHTHNEVGT